jgi:hypothetical protein
MSTTAQGLAQGAADLSQVESITTTPPLTTQLTPTDEKRETSSHQEKKKRPFSFLPSKNRTDEKLPHVDSYDGTDTATTKTAGDNGGDKKNKVDTKDKDKEPDFPPVAFSRLFRFHTRFDLAINMLGIVCAAASGAAQVSFPLLEVSNYN